MSFQVYQIDGFTEPWWFEDDWYEQVVAVETTDDLVTAAVIFQNKSLKLQNLFPKSCSRVEGMLAFWQPGETAWCEPCANDEQIYHSLVLYENQQALTSERVAELTQILEGLKSHPSNQNKLEEEG